ncbi:MAG: [protein-PII] uridylyltransferase [Ilumatobacteraceae bacterium]
MTAVDAATIRRMRAQVVGDPDMSGRPLARRLAQQADSWFESLADGLPGGWALLATGGYGRGVLAPGSDIDVVLLHPEGAEGRAVGTAAERLWYPFWDGGLKLGQAVHTTRSLLQLAASDLDTATSLLTARCVAGDAGAAAGMLADAQRQWRAGDLAWLARLLSSAEERWQRSGTVASLLEPDLKDGRGGLRDHDMVRWALQTGRADVASALEEPFDDLAGAAELLLAARCELHRATGTASNTLLLQEQDRVASAMGYADADALMLTIAGAAHAIEWASDRFWWRIGALLEEHGETAGTATRRRARSLLRRRSSRLGGTVATDADDSPAEITAGVVVVGGEAHIATGTDLDEQSAVFRFAAAAAHAGLPMSARSLRLLASRGVEPGEPWTEATRRAFLSLLGSGRWLVPTAEALERYALWSRFLPEWKVVRSRPQRNAFHRYTVDHHLLQAVVNANEFVRDVKRPDLLLVGTLLHDLGKGRPGDHTEVGIELCGTVLPRMGFDAADTAVVTQLVRHHLLLSETATRRDLADPRTAANVSAAVGDLTTLELLRALTEADSRATGPSAWSSWKASLVDELVDRTADVIRHGVPDRVEIIVPADLAELAAAAGAGGVRVVHVADGSVDLVRIAGADRSGLFATIAGVLALRGLDVLGASAFTVDGTAIDEFRVARSGDSPVDWTVVERELSAAMAGEFEVGDAVTALLRQRARRRRPVAAVPPRLEVLVSNAESDATTLVEVRAPDAPMVLYRLSHALSAHGLDIRSAVIATLGHEVVDSFYVRRAGSAGMPGQVPAADFDGVRAAVLAALAD